MLSLILLVPIIGLIGLVVLEMSRHERAEERWSVERDKLLQRIQAPERAIIDDYEPSEIYQYVPLDDDQAFQENREALSGESS